VRADISELRFQGEDIVSLHGPAVSLALYEHDDSGAIEDRKLGDAVEGVVAGRPTKPCIMLDIE
jgi:hypothetical protein